MARKIIKPTLEQVTRERWLRGRLDYKLHTGQQKLKEAFLAKSTGQLFVSEFGRQFGKTYFWCIVALEIAHRKPRAKIRIGTAFHTDLVEFIIPTFEEVSADCPEDLKPVYKQQKSKYICYNEAEIKLVGLDRKPNAMRGNALDFILIDEAGFTGKLDYLYKHVIIPTTTHRPECRIAMSSSTPVDSDHEFFDFVEKAKLENAYSVGTIHDNPQVDEVTIERLKYEMGGEDSPEWQTEYLCKRVRNATFAIIPEWDESKYVRDIPRDEYFKFYHKYVGMDLGVIRHKTATLFGHYDFLRSKLIVEDEFTIIGPDMTTEVIKDHVRDKESELWNGLTPYRRVSDNNNPLLLQDLSLLHQLHFLATDKGSLEEMVNTVRMLVKAGGLIVHPRCKQLIGCLNYGVWDERRDHFKEHKVYGHFDALAALIYLVRNLDRATNPIPYDFKVDRDNQIIFSTHRDTQPAVRTLKEAFGIKR